VNASQKTTMLFVTEAPFYKKDGDSSTVARMWTTTC